MTRSLGGGVLDWKPVWGAFGVAAWTLMGGGWRAKGLEGMELEDLGASTKRVLWSMYPSSIVGPAV